jgi:hypothetical protein
MKWRGGSDDRNGDKGSGELRLAKVHCTRVAINKVVTPDGGDRS